MIDFTIQIYTKLLTTLQQQGFEFLCYKDFQENIVSQKQIVLRHDVDARKENSLLFAEIQHKLGVTGTYYFRTGAHAFDEKVIKEIAGLGHEIGYHYEDVSLAVKTHKGTREEEKLIKIAFESFTENLERLRKIVPIKTICMHGSPMSNWDNRLLWKYYDYHDFGIIGEPYFDVDFNKVLYLTDTGRRWDGHSVSIRDKAIGGRRQAAEDQTKGKGREGDMYVEEKKNLTNSTLNLVAFPRFHATIDIIKAAEGGQLPEKIMITFHPQRWTDNPVPWVTELVWQNVKNMAKYFLVKIKR